MKSLLKTNFYFFGGGLEGGWACQGYGGNKENSKFKIFFEIIF